MKKIKTQKKVEDLNLPSNTEFKGWLVTLDEEGNPLNADEVLKNGGFKLKGFNADYDGICDDISLGEVYNQEFKGTPIGMDLDDDTDKFGNLVISKEALEIAKVTQEVIEERDLRQVNRTVKELACQNVLTTISKKAVNFEGILLPKLITYEEANLLKNSWRARTEYTDNIAWFLVHEGIIEVLCELLKDDKVVEVFSGTGYLSAHLTLARKGRGTLEAYDDKSRAKDHMFKYESYSKPYFGEVKDCTKLSLKEYDSVIMTWPEYDSPSALEVLTNMHVGQRLFYEGENYGGCTGDDAFFDYLDSNFEELQEESDKFNGVGVRFSGINDFWGVYVKVR